MWCPLNDSSVVEQYESGFSSNAPAPPALVTLLHLLQKKDWAADIYVATSLNHLSLTNAPSWNSAAACPSLSIEIRGEEVVVAFVDAGNRVAGPQRRCQPEELADVVELYVYRMLAKEKLPPRAFADNDPDHARLSLGQAVSVIPKLGHTPHSGTVREIIWHHKNRCWNYYLTTDTGKKLTKRYVAEDLEG
jgi:hypothetical protein